MANLRCHNCGQTNSADSTFCSKCASALRHANQLRQAMTRKVLLPPQDQLYHPQPTSASPSPRRTSSAGVWVMVGMIIVGVLMTWIAYINNG